MNIAVFSDGFFFGYTRKAGNHDEGIELKIQIAVANFKLVTNSNKSEILLILKTTQNIFRLRNKASQFGNCEPCFQNCDSKLPISEKIVNEAFLIIKYFFFPNCFTCVEHYLAKHSNNSKCPRRLTRFTHPINVASRKTANRFPILISLSNLVI